MPPEDKKNVSAGADALEAALFAFGEPMTHKKLCEALGVEHPALLAIAGDLKQKLAARGSGLALSEINDRLALITIPAHGEMLRAILKKEFSEDLTPAALETLAIVAYASPIPRAEIEYIRGVNSSFTIRNLLIRGLLEREPDPKHASSYRYRLSFDCLKHLGLGKIEDLPDYNKFRTLTDEFRSRESLTGEGKENPVV